jgi:uncharacterized protein (DUF1499 family)
MITGGKMKQTGKGMIASRATLLMGFIDDVELLLDSTGKLIQVKSASRVGQCTGTVHSL